MNLMKLLSKVLMGSICVLVAASSFAQPKKYTSLLWEITGKGLKKPSYLFGTMHVSSKMVFHLSDSFYYAIKNVDMVALEQNPTYWQRDMMDMDSNGKLISNYMRNGANNYLTEKSFQLQSFDDDIRAALTDAPLVVNSLLYRSYDAQEDYEENTYLDLYIYQTGRKLGKKAAGVEDYYQTERIVFEAYQDAMKDKTKHSRSTGESSFDIQKKIQAAYRQGDLDALDSLEKYEFSSPAFLEKFLYRRNEIQAHSIDTILQRNSLFVGVGAAHLPGKRGVIELLRRMGYRLRPIGMQDRNADRKDEIDKLKVPVAFREVKTDDGFITMKLPGALYKRNSGMANDNESWQYADMENGTYYTVIRVKTGAALLGESMNDVMRQTDSLLYENIPGRILSKTVSKQDGYLVISLTNRTRRGDLQRYRIIISPFEEVVCKMSGNDDYVNGEEADVFFNSIRVNYHPQQWKTFQSNGGGFCILLPQVPVCTVDKTNDNVLSAQWLSYDTATGNAYAILKKTVNNYGFLEEDTFDISLIEESLKRSKLVSREESRSFTKQEGFSALNMSFLLKNGSTIQARAVLRGAQYYVFLMASKKKEETAANVFFSSLHLTPFTYADATTYRDTSAHFSVQTSVVPVLDTFLMGLAKLSADAAFTNSYSGYGYQHYTNKTAFFQDDTTGEAVLVNMIQYPKYYYSKDSASFWEDVIDSSSYRSMIVHSKEPYRLDKSCSGFKVVLRDTNTVRQITILYLLKHNRLYKVTALSDNISGESAFVKNFLSTFRPDNDTTKTASLFINKQDLFFADYRSKDSVTHNEANDALSGMKFTCAALPKLSSIIGSFAYGDKNYFDNKSRFIQDLGFIDDSACVGETKRLLSKLYRQTSDTSFFQDEILSALARLKTTSAYDTLQALLLQDPPVFDDDNHYDDLFGLIEDSLPLAARMFPGLLQLSAIESYKLPVNHLLQVLVDSGLIKDSVYKTSFSRLYFDAKIEMKKMQNDDAHRMQSESEDDEDTKDVVLSPYLSSRSGYNSNPPEELSTYSSLLMPFYDSIASVPLFFQRQLVSKNPMVQMDAAIMLAAHKKSVPDSLWRSLVAQDKWRAILLKRLESIHRKELFPKSSVSQEDMARSLLLNDGNDAKFAGIQLTGKRIISFDGKKGIVYFFKYKTDKEDNWKIGISGLQPANAKDMSVDDKLTSMTGKNLSDDQPVLSQFEEELSKIILSRHESAYRFFKSDRYADFGFNDSYGN